MAQNITISGGTITAYGGTLTLTNAGNVSIIADLSFASTLDGITGTLSNATLTLSPTESGTAALTLEGKPNAALDDTRIGSIIIRILKKHGERMISLNIHKGDTVL